MAGGDYETLLYSASEGVATVTLNRPERLNTIVPPMPDELEAAVGRAVRDSEVKVIVVRGAGWPATAAGIPARTSPSRRLPRSPRRRSS